MPFEEVRDFFYDRMNYIGELDEAAEDLFDRHGMKVGGLDTQLTALLADQLGITVLIDDGDVLSPNAKRSYDPGTKRLRLPTGHAAGVADAFRTDHRDLGDRRPTTS
jgi:predicted transcriptional regulator